MTIGRTREGPRLPIRVLLTRLVVLGLLPAALLGACTVYDTISAQRRATERSVLERFSLARARERRRGGDVRAQSARAGPGQHVRAILALGMPGMDGFQLARALRQADPGWDGRLVALTGYGQEADKARSRDACFAIHLTKPVDISALLAAIEAIIRPAPAAAVGQGPRSH